MYCILIKYIPSNICVFLNGIFESIDMWKFKQKPESCWPEKVIDCYRGIINNLYPKTFWYGKTKIDRDKAHT